MPHPHPAIIAGNRQTTLTSHFQIASPTWRKRRTANIILAVEILIGFVFFRKPSNADSTTVSMGSELVQSAECDHWQELLIQAIVDHGDLPEARFVALEALKAGCDEATLAAQYREKADELLAKPFSVNGESNSTAHLRRRVQAVVDPAKCWTSTANDGVNIMLYLWDKCCSQIKEKDDIYKKQKSTSHDIFLEQTISSSSGLGGFADSESNECIVEGKPLCCEFHARTRSYLRLPAIREVALRVRVQSENGIEESFDLEQDGFLRRFDVASILWPSGYFLALCVAAPAVCGIPELDEVATSNKMAFVIELGTGIGLPSIAFARMLARRETEQRRPNVRVVATDKPCMRCHSQLPMPVLPTPM